MFVRPSVPLPLTLRPQRDHRNDAATALLRLSLGLAFALSAGFAVASPVNAAVPDASNATGPSIQYLESVSHASKKYSFTPGAVTTVPFTPRRGDSTLVDGAAPVALPAGNGTMAAPSTASPGVAGPSTTAVFLRREVLGFLPYWELGSTLDYNTLSTIAYFGVDLNANLSNPSDPTIGTIDRTGSDWNGWNSSSMTTVINNAHAHGTRVALTIESFAWDSNGAAYQTQVLSTPTIRARMAADIAGEVVRRGADGVNLDFEPIASAAYSNYVLFVQTLRQTLDAIHPGYELTFCATGSAGSYDLAHLLAPGAADATFIMGYDLRGGSPSVTGSIDPLTSTTNTYTLTGIVNYFLTHGAPASKVILGLPWYGHAWSTGSANPVVNAPPGSIATYGAPATGVSYATSAGLASRNPATTSCSAGWPVPCVNGWQYDTGEQTAWTAYYGDFGGTSTTWRELYFDDSRSFGAKIDAIDGWNLRGLGIWALGYDNNNGDGDLTNTIVAKLEVNATPSTYSAVAPSRILDSRKGLGLPGPLGTHVAQTFQVTGTGGVPAGATAVTGNLTVTGQTSSGYLYLGPAATNNPTSSTLNFPLGDDRANGVTVALSGGGTLSVTYVSPTSGKSANVIFDVTGYFTPDASGASYVPLTPSRILDSRKGLGLPGPLGTHVAQTFQVTGTGGVPAGATAVTGNLTVTGQTSSGYLYLGPAATNNPTSSTLNFPLGDDRANGVTVALSGGGTLSVTYVSPTSGKSANVIFDVTGYFTPAGGSAYVPLTPSRILDTRNGTGGITGQIGSHSAQGFQVTGAGGVPANATAVTGNLTVTGQTSAGYLYLGPNATDNPTSSTLNFPLGDDRANGVTVALSGVGTLSVTYVAPTPGKATYVIFDVTGYFAP